MRFLRFGVKVRRRFQWGQTIGNWAVDKGHYCGYEGEGLCLGTGHGMAGAEEGEGATFPTMLESRVASAGQFGVVIVGFLACVARQIDKRQPS
jgi:hypothetical protein